MTTADFEPDEFLPEDPEQVEQMVAQFREQMDAGMGWDLNEHGKPPVLTEEQAYAIVEAFIMNRLETTGVEPENEEILEVIREIELALVGATTAELVFKGLVWIDRQNGANVYSARPKPRPDCWQDHIIEEDEEEEEVDE